MCPAEAYPKITFPDRRPLFYYITDRRQLVGIPLTRCIRKTLRWGVDFIQIREKDLSDGALYRLVREAVSLARGTDSKILVNGRADIAWAAGAHGVHLPSSGLQISDLRRWLPKGFLIGVSAHTGREIQSACAQNADYVLLGHVFPTKSKLAYGRSLGLAYLKKICIRSSVPVFGLGGMRPELIAPVIDAGAAGIAGISLFQIEDEFNRLKSITGRRQRASL